MRLIANSDNTRKWRHLDFGLMWLIVADSDDEVIDLLISLSTQATPGFPR